MYLRTISSQQVDYIENNFTLEELSSDVGIDIIGRLIDSREDTSIVYIKDYDTSTKVNLEV